jgi:hypothetical protein
LVVVAVPAAKRIAAHKNTASPIVCGIFCDNTTRNIFFLLVIFLKQTPLLGKEGREAKTLMADLEALLGPKATGKKLSTEPVREISKEQRVAALKVAVRVETPQEKEKRKREKEEIKYSLLSEEEKQKRARIESALADNTAFLLALAEEERRHLEANTLVPDGSEQPATSNTWKVQEEANLQAADEARADRADSVLDLGMYYRQRLFPVDAVVQYVTRNGRIPLRQCEFAVITQHDVFWRHRHFERADGLRNWLADVGPKRLEIGPWHMELSKVSMGKEPYDKLPLQRYLAFDFDMSDFIPGEVKAETEGYIRKCRCRTIKNGTCSYGCWFYMKVGVKVQGVGNAVRVTMVNDEPSSFFPLRS